MRKFWVERKRGKLGERFHYHAMSQSKPNTASAESFVVDPLEYVF